MPTIRRLVFHIDMDSFFASVEKRDHPGLRDRPVIIGADPMKGKGRGVVSTCCYIAREYGVRSAMPISRAYRLCPHAVFIRPNMERYKETSRNIMEILASFADSFEPVSIDEAYLDVTCRVEGYGGDGHSVDGQGGGGCEEGSGDGENEETDEYMKEDNGDGYVFKGDRKNEETDEKEGSDRENEPCKKSEGEGRYRSPRALAYAIKKEIFKRERLTCSIGIASSKSVAKIASDMDKPNGITEVPPGGEAEFLAFLPVDRLSGIGKKTGTAFCENGIETIGQLAEASEEYLRERIGDFAVGFKYIAMGMDDRPVEPYEGVESISRERTFMEDTGDEEVIMANLRRMARLVHRNALRERVRYRTIGIKVRLADFTTFTREKSIPVPVNTFSPIMEIVNLLWQEFSPPPQKIRLLGVRVSGLESGGYVQTTLERWIGEL